MYLRDKAIVLRQKPFREHDSIVVLFGRVHGKLEVLARGAKKSNAKQAGHLEPFSEVDVMIAKGKSLDKLAVAKILDPHAALRKRLSMLAVCGAFCDLVDRLTRPGQADPLIYDLLDEALGLAQATEAEPSPERSRLLFAAASLKLLDLLGYALHMDRCIACRQPLADPCAFVSDAGGFLCSTCLRERRRDFPKAEQLPHHALSILRFLRLKPLKNVLGLTATTEIFAAASSVVEQSLSHAPLEKEAHGPRTISAMLA